MTKWSWLIGADYEITGIFCKKKSFVTITSTRYTYAPFNITKYGEVLSHKMLFSESKGQQSADSRLFYNSNFSIGCKWKRYKYLYHQHWTQLMKSYFYYFISEKKCRFSLWQMLFFFRIIFEEFLQSNFPPDFPLQMNSLSLGHFCGPSIP